MSVGVSNILIQSRRSPGIGSRVELDALGAPQPVNKQLRLVESSLLFYNLICKAKLVDTGGISLLANGLVFIRFCAGGTGSNILKNNSLQEVLLRSRGSGLLQHTVKRQQQEVRS